MKRRPTHRTVRARDAGLRKVQNEQNVWTFFQEGDATAQWGVLAGSTTLSFDTSGMAFKEGDVITISGGDDNTIKFYGMDFAYVPIKPKRIHPARRRKAIRKEKELMNNQITLTSGGSSVMCEKISNSEWKVMGDIN